MSRCASCLPCRHRTSNVLAWLVAMALLCATGALLKSAPLRVGTDLRPHEKAIILRRAAMDIGIREKTGRNDGRAIESAQRRVGAPLGSAWCMAIVYVWVDDAVKALGRQNPLFRSGSTQTAFSKTMEMWGLATSQAPEAGDIVIWRIPRSWIGHAGLITRAAQGTMETIEGNTSSGLSGSQRDGDGVYRRRRSMTRAMGRLVIRGYIG